MINHSCARLCTLVSNVISWIVNVIIIVRQVVTVAPQDLGDQEDPEDLVVIILSP